jgi:catechol 2,3-dioxygenase-like lactoylglutathione lyase family enzyme
VFERVTIRVADREASERFYETVLSTLGIRLERSELSLVAANEEHQITRGLHMTFRGPVAGVQLDPDGNRVELVS